MSTDLEAALAKAFEDSAHIPAFLRLLVDSPVLVLIPRQTQIVTDEKTGEVVGLELAQLTTRDGKKWVPFYSSESYAGNLPPKLQALGKAKIKARQLFKIIRGGQAVLNPNSDLTKPFDAGEIDDILSAIEPGGVWAEKLDVEGTVAFIDPRRLPQELVALLVVHCLKTPEILDAWIALKKMDGETTATVLLMLKVAEDFEAAARSAGQSLSSLPAKPPFLDIIQDDGGLLSRAVKEHALRVK